jgi:hypothetical protein
MVAWHVAGCFEDALYAADLDDRAVAAGPSSCRLRLRSKALHVRRGRAEIPIACPDGCSDVHATLRFSTNDVALGPTVAHVKPGRALLRVRLSKAQARRLKSGVRLELAWAGLDGDFSILGTKVTLRAP